MAKRSHLRRLNDADYKGLAVVHWTMTIRERKTGWLNDLAHFRFRELLTHSQFRYAIACPIFCLMPDHAHLMWMGINDSSNQKLAIRHLRTRWNDSLNRSGFELQDQSFDHVLRDDERQVEAFIATCEYIAKNPERAGLVGVGESSQYPFSGCLVPGYPELSPFEPVFWVRFDRAVSFLRKNGLVHPGSVSEPNS